MKLFYGLALIGIVVLSGLNTQSNDWEYYVGKPYIDTSNATDINSFDNTPESIVTYFYASKIRQDGNWVDVLPMEEYRSVRLQNKLKKYEKCQFTRFRLIGKKEYAKNRLWIKVYMEVEFENQMAHQVDEVAVDFVEDKWIITSVPS